MKKIASYRCFKGVKGVIALLLGLILTGSQFPLSSHCYKMLFPDHSSSAMTCMKDGTCMMGMSRSQMSSDCHSKHGDRPFFCSFGVSGHNMSAGIQLSKVMLPDLLDATRSLFKSTIIPLFDVSDLQVYQKDVFHPPQMT